MIVLCSFKIHENMLKSVLHSKIKFFESTPIGRILNRFSNDIMTIDFKLNAFFKNFSYYLLELFSVLILLVISAPVFIIFLIPVVIFYLIIQVNWIYLRKYIASQENYFIGKKRKSVHSIDFYTRIKKKFSIFMRVLIKTNIN